MSPCPHVPILAEATVTRPWDERVADRIAARIAKREQQRALRAELAAARKIGKAKYHRFRLTVADTTTKEIQK